MAASGGGMIVGTAAFMSPEQVRGKSVDKRSDIWALGCVIFEMLTGRQAFAGEDDSDILASVLKSDPDWSLLPVNTPQLVRLILRRCLQKDKDERARSAADIALQIRDARISSTQENEQTQIPARFKRLPKASWRR